MQIIQFNDVDPKLNWTMMADALEAGHKLAKADFGDLLLTKADQGFLNRGAWITELGLILKSATIFPENSKQTPPLPSVHSGVLLFDGDNGTLKAMLDGQLVTKWKTAGDSVLGARLLANPEPDRLLIVGAGTVARSLVEAYREIFPSLQKIEIWNRTAAKAELLAEELMSKGFPVTSVGDLEGSAKVADIISVATMSNTPILKGAWIQSGTHVDLIGAYRPDMREADDDLMRKAELFVDSRETTIEEIGELIIPIANGAITAGDVRGDLYDLCNGAAGRSSPGAITVYKNGGDAHLDLMTGAVIYDVANR
ncbi:MAG: ornithine cyclodeaminase [Sneathiella sp.]|nr:MAG: ornithine cyclodeaminase [Sneathiella sp.]